ncbi:dual specificity protein phosphatase family protein [Candidatus Woesearchaeota archaeon]|nr:dual specificity protein phosphatase family protein [Candidatus Woesearchaeota archaeon]
MPKKRKALAVAANTKVIPHGKPRFEYSRITPYIFLGTDMCCTQHFREELLSKGIAADVSLRGKHIDTPFGVKYFLWLPTRDHYAPSQQQLLLGASAMDTLVKQKIKTYVHCKAGHGRSPTLVAAYFILEGKNAKDAVAAVRRKRPGIHPTAVQLKALERFEKLAGRLVGGVGK